jgi:hypothetical protein
MDNFYITYFDIITDSKMRQLMVSCNNVLIQHKPKTLHFLFSSLGGNIDSAVAFIPFLKHCLSKKHFTILVVFSPQRILSF